MNELEVWNLKSKRYFLLSRLFCFVDEKQNTLFGSQTRSVILEPFCSRSLHCDFEWHADQSLHWLSRHPTINRHRTPPVGKAFDVNDPRKMAFTTYVLVTNVLYWQPLQSKQALWRHTRQGQQVCHKPAVSTLKSLKMLMIL